MFPTSMSTDLNATYGKMTIVPKEDTILSLVKNFMNMHLKVDSREPLYSYHMKNISYDEVERFSGIVLDF